MLTPETNQGGRGAVPHSGCKMPLLRMVPPLWSPTCPSTNKASWFGAFRRSTGYEFAGHGWLKRRGTALDWNQAIDIDITCLGRPSSNLLHRSATMIAGNCLQDAKAAERRLDRYHVTPANRRPIDDLKACEGETPFTPPTWSAGGSRWSLKGRCHHKHSK